MNEPVIKTALPKRQYQIGEFIAKVLGDIESGDGNRYRHIFAVVREGQAKPALYVVTVPTDGQPGQYTLRVISPTREMDVSSDGRWGDLDAFVDGAIQVAQQMLGLKDEVPLRLG